MSREQKSIARREAAATILGAFGVGSILAGCATNADGSTEQPLQGSSSALWFDTYSELRAVSGGTTTTSTNVAIGRGTTGERAVFVWDTDTTTPDDGYYVIAASSSRTGSWKRIHNFSFNVRLFGAKGDGSTDDSAAIRSAIAAASAGGEVFFPAGTYLVSQDGSNAWCLHLTTGNVMLRGSGRGASVIKLAASQDTWSRIVTATSVSDVTVRDLTIDGNKAAQGEDYEQQHGLFFDTCSNIVVESVEIKNTRGDGIYLFGGCTETAISGCSFTGGDRVHLHAACFTNLSVTNCNFFSSNGNNHIKQEPDVTTSSGVTVTGCTFDGDTNSSGVTFSGNYVSGTTYLTTDITVSGNVFRNLAFGVCLGEWTQGWSIVGNILENCQCGIQNISYSGSNGYDENSHVQISGNTFRNSNGLSVDNYPIFLSNCTVGSIDGNTVYAPQTFQALRIAHCDRVSVTGNSLSVGSSSSGIAEVLVAYRCKNCSLIGNLVDVPSATTPIGIYVADDATYPSSNIVVKDNLILGAANPAVRVDVQSSNAVAVGGNVAPGATTRIGGTSWPLAQPLTVDVQAVQRLSVAPGLSVSLSAGNNNDLAPSGINSTSYVALSAASAATVTGINAGADGDILYVVNFGSAAVTFAHNATGSSSAANCFYLGGAANQVLSGSYGRITLRYDHAFSRWIQIG